MNLSLLPSSVPDLDALVAALRAADPSGCLPACSLGDLALQGLAARAVQRLRTLLNANEIDLQELAEQDARDWIQCRLGEDGQAVAQAALDAVRASLARGQVLLHDGTVTGDWTNDRLSAWLQRQGHGGLMDAPGLVSDLSIWAPSHPRLAPHSLRNLWSQEQHRVALCRALVWFATRWRLQQLDRHHRAEALSAQHPALTPWLTALRAAVASDDLLGAEPAQITVLHVQHDPVRSRLLVHVTGRVGEACRSWKGSVGLPSGGSPTVTLDRQDALPTHGRLALLAGVEQQLIADAELAEGVLARVEQPAWTGLTRALQGLNAPALEEIALTGLAWRLREVNCVWQLLPSAMSTRDDGSRSARTVDVHTAERLATLPADHAALIALSRDTAPDRAILSALNALAGHPRVMLYEWGGGLPVTVAREEVSLHLEPHPEGAVLVFRGAGAVLAPDTVVLRQLVVDSGGERVVVLSASPRQVELARMLSEEGSVVPLAVLDSVMASLTGLTRSHGLQIDAALVPTYVLGSTEPMVLLKQADEGVVQVHLRVQPVPGGDLLAPGTGPATAYVSSPDGLIAYGRNLAAEGKAATELRSLLDLDTLARDDAPWAWGVQIGSRLFQLLDAAATLGVGVDWSGPALTIKRAEISSLKVTSLGADAWFGAGGELTVDDEQVPWATLVEAARGDRSFVRLHGGRVVRLSRALRRTLRSLDAASEGPEWAVPAALHAAEEAGAQLSGAATFMGALQRLREAHDRPWQAPEGLEATLHPHQELGAAWLSRLAAWAPGAVLADDMGLGKTVQALALLTERAASGPALVVTPTSVSSMWLKEAARFCPGLEVHAYRGSGRARLLEELGAGEVLVTSYGMLRRDAEALAEQPFATVVFDEAQALKNHRARTTVAARGLKADFRVALTGTPVENHLGELWSLIGATLPGLLGSWETFRHRFAVPIEGEHDAEALTMLSTLIRPFVLRRTKSEVAAHLPARLEELVPVTLSSQERVLYDQIRLETLERLGRCAPNEAGMIVLRGLHRLRLAANAPALLDEQSPLPSAKRARVTRLLQDELATGRNVLVFSQFLGQLKAMRTWLDSVGVPYASLDGSTPPEARVAEVEAFQAGRARVFLISLRAGGTGLTLTAAQSVIHLDPWWNPAVEDQATDRAHRLGQTHDVRVYRMVSLDTVEEQILSLHASKRTLAAGVLEGTGAAARLSTTELTALLQVHAVAA